MFGELKKGQCDGLDRDISQVGRSKIINPDSCFGKKVTAVEEGTAVTESGTQKYLMVII